MKYSAYVLVPNLVDVEAQVEALMRPYDNYHLELLLAGKDITAMMQTLGVNEQSEFAHTYEAYLKQEKGIDVSYLLFENGNYYDCIETQGGYFNWYELDKHSNVKTQELELPEKLEGVVCKATNILALDDIFAEDMQFISAVISDQIEWQDANDYIKENDDGSFNYQPWETKFIELLKQHHDYFVVEVRCGA